MKEPSEDVKSLILSLLEKGVSYVQISNETGVHWEVINRLHRENFPLYFE